MSRNANVPTNVPAPVPGNEPSVSALNKTDSRVALPISAPRSKHTPSYLSGGPAGWRFQMRLPIRFSTCDSQKNRGQFLKKHLGPGSKRDAIEKSRRLAFIVTSLFQYLEISMLDSTETHSGDQDSSEGDLLARVISACKAGIDRALAEPHYAITFASNLQSSLQALTSVGGVIGNPSTNPALHAAGPAIVADALTSIIKAAATSVADVTIDDAAKILTDEKTFANSVGPVADPQSVAGEQIVKSEAGPSKKAQSPATPIGNDGDRVTFADIAKLYMETRDQAGADQDALNALKLKAKTFIEVVGDRPINEYNPFDLQAYANEMQYLVKNATKYEQFKGLSAKEIIAKNRDFQHETISRKTLQDGYIATVRSIINFGSQVYRFNNPFAGMQLRYSKMLKESVSRESISSEVLNAIFANGVMSGHLDAAILPLLGYLTSRRLALLVHLRGSDFRQRDGIWLAQVYSLTRVGGTLTRIPTKTEASTGYFVLHRLLEEIGFIDWARTRTGWVFEEIHTHADPSDYASKIMSRLFKSSGAIGENREVFHSLRHMAIDERRETDLQARDRKLQSGHSLGADEHENYGSKTITPAAARKIRDAPLPAKIDFSVFHDLDFDALAAARRSRHAPKRKGAVK